MIQIRWASCYQHKYDVQIWGENETTSQKAETLCELVLNLIISHYSISKLDLDQQKRVLLLGLTEIKKQCDV